MDTDPRLILLLSDEVAACPFTSERTWYAGGLVDLDVDQCRAVGSADEASKLVRGDGVD